MNFIKQFIELTRAYALTVTIASCLLVYIYANISVEVDIINFIILTAGLCAVHLGGNLYDDYIDVRKKLDENIPLNEISFDSFLPKARLITNGTFSLETVRTIIKLLFYFAIAIGFSFVYASGFEVLFFMFIGAVLTLFYPYSSRYNLAEATIGLIYGPLIINGGYYALTGKYDPKLMFISIAIFFTTLVLLHTHNIMDWEFDIKNNKKTLAILSKTKKNAIRVLIGIIFMSYAIIVYGVFRGMLNPHMLYVFLTLPIATELIDSMKEYVNLKNTQLKPRWYWGMFENWKSIEENNVAFFFYRFYLARNFGFLFALFAALGATV